MKFLLSQDVNRSFQVLVDINAQSFFLGIAAVLVLIFGTYSFIISYIKKSKKKSKFNLKNLNDEQTELMKLLIDTKEVPIEELKNLIIVKNLSQNLDFLVEKDLIKKEKIDNIDYIILKSK